MYIDHGYKTTIANFTKAEQNGYVITQIKVL